MMPRFAHPEPSGVGEEFKFPLKKPWAIECNGLVRERAPRGIREC